MTIDLKRKGLRIAEVKVDMAHRAAPTDLTILVQQHRTYDLQGLSVKAQLLLDTRGATPTGAAHRL